MDRRQMTLAVGSLLALGAVTPASARKAPVEWDGLVRVKSKRLEYVYLLPGADFRDYRRVMIDPTEVAFKKNWLRRYNSTVSGLEGRVSERDLQEVIRAGARAADEILAQTYADAGYPVVTEGGSDVLRLRVAVADISVTAPDVGIHRSLAEEAGFATLSIEARDALSGALLGRAVDKRTAGYSTLWRNSMTNRSDFRALMKRWAGSSVKGLNELKAQSPINDQGARQG